MRSHCFIARTLGFYEHKQKKVLRKCPFFFIVNVGVLLLFIFFREEEDTYKTYCAEGAELFDSFIE